MKPSGLCKIGPLCCLLWLAACSPPAADQSLDAWMLAERQAAAVTALIKPLPEPVTAAPPTYAVAGLVDPFRSDRLTRPAGGAPASPNQDWALAGLGPKRVGQALEAFPLDSMTLVGTLSSGELRVALVKVAQQIYPVRTGDFLGLHQGRVRRITEQSIELRERVQDAQGAWIERPVSLQVQEEPRK